MIFARILLYFGALLVPAYYFFTRGKYASAGKAMLFGVVIQFVWIVAVGFLVHHSRRAGYRDYYYGWALLIPMNFVAVVYYAAVWILRGRTRPDNSPEATPGKRPATEPSSSSGAPHL